MSKKNTLPAAIALAVIASCAMMATGCLLGDDIDTLRAKAETGNARSYTVAFSANGGSGTTPTTWTVTAGSSITLPNGSGLTRTGYTFSGWNTNSSGTGTNYSAGSSYTPTGNITLYARWSSDSGTERT